MAESLVGKIVSNAGKQWSRNTVADGNWLNSNTVQKFNQNDQTLAEAIEGLSAAMEHFTPEITPSAWDCESKQTIKSLRQSSDGHLELELQPIDFGETTLSDKVWAYLHQTGFKQVVNQYQDITVGSGSSQDYGFNLVAGELTDNTLSLQAGIYDIKIELLYNTSKTPVEHIVKVGLFLNAVSGNPIIEDHCYFNDSYTIENDVAQVRWLNFTIKVDTASLLKIGVTSPDGAIGQVCANKVLIMSAGGATGKQGEPGPQGPNGISPTVNVTDITGGKHIVISGADGEHPFDIMNGTDGASGEDGKTPLLQINSTNAHWQYRYGTSESWQDIPNTPAASGTKGNDGISPKVRINDETNYWEISEDGGTTWDPTNVSATGAPGRNGTNGISPTVSSQQITGGNRVTFTYDNGGTPATESIDVMSGTSGTNGTNGVSPSITTAPIEGSPAGTRVIITDATHPASDPLTFDVMNGRDGAGATYTFDNTTLSGDGSNTPIGVDTSYMATQSWVGQQGFLKNSDLTDYATKTYANEASAAALSQAETWVETEGYLKAVPAEYATKTYANDASANALSQAETWVQSEGYLKSVSSSGSIQGDGTTLSPLTLKTSAEQALSSVNGKIDKSQLEINANTNLIKYTDGNSSSAISAVNYRANLADSTIVPQRLVVVTGDQEIIDHYGDYSENKYGTIFFVTSAHN